ncbi:MAG TPA: peptide chain release factor N(5)-glutamine methyltransferase [Mycobacteriales bacterium]|nr:peptide chain release factor N(5)-glutamine methyltransferase [Mycobacteriales bacterium]
MTPTAAPEPDLTGLLASASRRLAAAGIAAADQEAMLLAQLARSRAAGSARALFADLVGRRAARVPLAHLTGSVRFRQIEMLVGPGVFVPQPETGPVVDWAVDALRRQSSAGSRGPVCVDLCTGAGTIALCLAAELPGASVHAVELDPDALAWAARNVEHNGVAVTLHLGDARNAAHELDGHVDLVASNPPYVATAELPGVHPEVRDHDPAVALHAGPDGLDVIRAVEAAARRLVRPGGLVVVEHSDRQGRSAPAVFAASGAWTDLCDRPDQEGRDRFVTAIRRP